MPMTMDENATITHNPQPGHAFRMTMHFDADMPPSLLKEALADAQADAVTALARGLAQKLVPNVITDPFNHQVIATFAADITFPNAMDVAIENAKRLGIEDGRRAEVAARPYGLDQTAD